MPEAHRREDERQAPGRAWLMVDAMNRLFRNPLVATVAGGRGGASLTPNGEDVVAAYRSLQHRVRIAVQAEEGGLLARLR